MHTAHPTTAIVLGRAAAWLGALAAWVVVEPSGVVAAEAKGEPRPGLLVIDEPPSLFVPAKPRSEAETDRRDALALFSAARIHENRNEDAEALRLYQRAFRCDPQSATVARAIVPLAIRLNRHSEAVRYALKLAELDEPDPPLLKRLAGYLTEIGDFAQALALLEKALKADASATPSAENVALWLDVGRLCFLNEQYAKAAEHFERVMKALEPPNPFGLDAAARKKLFGDPVPLFAMIGEAFLQAGQPEKAEAAFRKGHEAAPNPGLLGYHLAKVDLKRGKPEAALAKLQECFDARLAIEDTGPYVLLAEALRAIGKEGELIERLEKLRGANPDNFALGYFLAEQYFQSRKLEQAEKLYRDLIARRPMVTGYRHLVEIYRGNKRFEELLKVLGEAADKLGALDGLATKPGQALADDSELVVGVVDAARKLLKSDPKSLPPSALLAVALLASDARQWDTAGEFFDLAIRAQPDQAARLLLTWGLGLMMKEEHGRAAKVFQRGVDEKVLGADDPTFDFYLAGALEMAGQTEPALAAARTAAELAQKRAAAKASDKSKETQQAKDELPRYLIRPAWVLYHAKRYDEAISGYREVVRKYGQDYSSGEIRRAVREARLVLSNLAVLKSDLPQAEEWLEQVLDEFPDDPSALNDLGYLWADQGKRLDRAHRMIRSAVQQEPENAAYLDSLGWVLFRKGKVNEAVVELEKAARLDPDPTVLDHLGDAYRAAGQNAKAAEAYRKAAAAYRQAGEQKKAVQVEAKIKSLT
jgi:tetratricopeptide (TPR) repeat protein